MGNDDTEDRFFTADEQAEIRRNLREANAASLAEVLSRGVTINPRVAARRAKMAGEKQGE